MTGREVCTVGAPAAVWGIGRWSVTTAVVIALWALRAAAITEEPAGSVALTIYSTASPGAIPPELYRPVPQTSGYSQQYSTTIPGYAVVKQEREIPIEKGRGTVRFTDVAAQIDPTTVTFASLTDPTGTRVLEQSYQFDLVSAAKLMERYLDRTITVEQARGDNVATFTGTLTSTAGGLILRDTSGAVQVISGYSNARFPELPGGLITKPTLVWDIAAEKAGSHQTRVTYQTDGITWWADYNIIFTEGKDANSGALDLSAWVSIINQSGAGYPDAKLKLVAGDVHRAPRRQARTEYAEAAMRKMRAGEAGFEEKAFFEYHLYTLGRPTTLPNNSTKQIELFTPAHDVPCDKVLVYYGLGAGFRGIFANPMTDRDYGTSEANPKVDIYLRFKNTKGNGVGMPLPSGRVRVSKLDPADKSLEFIGEDAIDHTPKDEMVLINLGSAFDIVGERKQIDFKVDTKQRWLEEEIEIKLRNHKDEAVTVIVKENLYRWVNWEITQKTQNYEKIDSRTIHFPVQVKRDGEATVRYRVRYTW